MFSLQTEFGSDLPIPQESWKALLFKKAVAWRAEIAMQQQHLRQKPCSLLGGGGGEGGGKWSEGPLEAPAVGKHLCTYADQATSNLGFAISRHPF